MGFYDVDGAQGPRFGAEVWIRRALIAGIVVLIAGGWFVYDKHRKVAPPPESALLAQLAPPGATLLEGLGTYSKPVASKNPEVQKWFDQGLMLTYGFNHDAAERSFLRATELDPECAMCWWGAALVLGPHVNAPMAPGNYVKAWERAQKALALTSRSEGSSKGNSTDHGEADRKGHREDKASASERAYIQALSARYAQDPKQDRTALDTAYSQAMGELVKQFPDDLDATTLYAEALMDLQPWNYWDAQQQPKGNILQIVAQLESVMARNKDHPGALHLYIHAVEASSDPQRGVDAADRLRELLPGSGHLVHMPAHIYTRVGRYNDAVLANRKAIEADEKYLAICRPLPGIYALGYVPHNYHFLWWAASMQGSRAVALAAAEETAKRAGSPEMLRAPDSTPLQDFWVTPLKARVQFAQWKAIESTPEPDKELEYPRAIWHFAQGMAAAYQKDPDVAQDHLKKLAKFAADVKFDTQLIGPQHPASATLKIAEKVLAGAIAQMVKDYPAAIRALEQGVALEDAVAYFEPPLWHQPVRQKLGAVLMASGRITAAEKVYLEDLKRNPESGMSLYGLQQSLLAQNREGEAVKVAERLERAWAHADVLPSDLFY